MSAEHVRASRGAYADSVTLMQVSAKAQAIAGVRAALVAMATGLNLSLLGDLGLTAPPGVGEHDLLVAIKADDAESLAAALEVVEAGLVARSPGPAPQRLAGCFHLGPPRARSRGRGLASRWCRCPGSMRSPRRWTRLGAGCDVMIFSDNMPVEQEIKLKEHRGRARAARDGTRLRHRDRRRSRPGVRQRRQARAYRARGGVGHGRAAPVVPARRGGVRLQRGTRSLAGATCPLPSAAGRPGSRSRPLMRTPIPN